MSWSYQGAFHSPWQNHFRVECRWYYQNVNASTRTVDVLAETYLQSEGGYWIDASFTGSALAGGWGGGSTRQYSNPGGATTYFTGHWQTAAYNANGELSVQVGAALNTNNVITFNQGASMWVDLPSIAPLATSGLSVVRTSDTQHVLSWTVPGGVSYTNVVVQRATDGGAWQEVGRPSGNASSWTDLTTEANRRYQYRVAGNRAGRQSAWSNTAEVFTTPGAPSGVSAVKVGSDIEVSVSGLPPYATAYDVYDGASLVGSDVAAFPWLHVAPNAAVTHTYTVRAKRGVLVSADSVPSNTVQLLTAPNAPTGLAPNGGVAASDVAVPLSWTHNSVDTTAQTEYELRHRPVSGAWTTVSGTTAQFRDVSLAVGDFEWQVRTKGQHPDWSAWSAVATVTVVTRPGVAVTQPDTGWDQPVLPVEWSWLQAQGRPQSGWRVELLDALGQRVEFREGSGAQTELTLDTRLTHDTAYTVRVQAATGTVWSAWAVQAFTVAFVAPADVSVVSQWDEGAGSMGLALSEGRGPVVGPVTNLFTNPNLVGDGTWAETRRNLFKMPQLCGPIGAHQFVGLSAFVGGGAPSTYISSTLLSNNPPNDNYIQLGGFDPAYHIAMSPGDVYSVSAEIRTDVGVTAGIIGYPLDAGGSFIGGPILTVAVPNTPSWGTRFGGVTAPAPAGTVRLGVFIPVLGPAGQWLFVTKVLVENYPEVRPYFDGDTPYFSVDPDMRQRWLGTANASESVMEIERVAGLTAKNCIAGVSTWEGEPAVRQIPTVASNNSYAALSVPSGPARSSGTLLGTSRLLAPLTGSTFRAGALRVITPDQALSAIPNIAGSYPQRFEYAALTSNYQVRLMHGGSVGSGDVWWTDIGLFAGEYDGPAFAGGDRVEWNGSLLYADWDGSADNSTTTATMVPEVETVTIERSVDGVTWVPWITGLTLDEVANLTDYESLSYGVTRYRVTGGALSGAASIVVHEAVSDSGAFWLSGGVGYADVARLPYRPAVQLEDGRERYLERYEGRALGVPYAGEQLTRIASVSGRTRFGDDATAGVYELAEVVRSPEATHLLRWKDGYLYGMVSHVVSPREGRSGVWGYSFSVEESEH